MNTMQETITWHDVRRELPDHTNTVLVQTTLQEDPVRLGFHDEHGWHLADFPGSSITVTAWAEIPTGPIGQKG